MEIKKTNLIFKLGQIPEKKKKNILDIHIRGPLKYYK